MVYNLLILFPIMIFKNEEKLFPAYLPEFLPGRETEIEKMKMLFQPTIKRNIPINIMINGPSGSGKTTIGKKISQYLERESENLKLVYLNCMDTSTNDMAVMEIMKQLNISFPESGHPFEKKFHSISKYIKEGNIHLLVVLDEADMLIKREKSSNLIYLFTRAKELERGNISSIIISVDDIRPQMEPQTAGMFGNRNMLTLEKYKEKQLTKILKERIKLALLPDAILDESISFIAKLVAEEGSARVALNTLWYAGCYAQERGYKRITPECVRAGMAQVHPTTTETKLKNLDRKQKILLLAICEALSKHDESGVNTGRAAEIYNLLCESYEAESLKRSGVSIWRMAKELEKEAIIITEVKHSAAGTTTLLYLRDAPAKELRNALVKMI